MGKKSKKKLKNQANGSVSQSKNLKSIMRTNVGTGKELVSSLGKEATNYIRSLANPITGALPTIPSLPAMLTRRDRVYCKGVFSTSGAGSAAGFGFIVMNPIMALTNDQATVAWSFSGYTSAVFPPTLGPAGVGYTNSNGPYAANNYSAGGLSGRVVAACLRIRYAGTELNRGGYFTGLCEPNHISLSNYAFNSIDGYRESVRFHPDKEWTMLNYRPVLDTDDDMIHVIPAENAGAGVVGQFYMGFALVDATGGSTPLSYEWEAYTCVEYSGFTVPGSTPSTVDLQGYSAAHSAAVFTKQMNSPSKTPADQKADLLHAAAEEHHRALSGTKILDHATGTVSSLGSIVQKSADFASRVVKGVGTLGEMLEPIAGLFF